MFFVIVILTFFGTMKASELSEVSLNNMKSNSQVVNEIDRINSISEPNLAHQDLIKIYNQLKEFPLGQFLLSEKMLDGNFTNYVVNYKRGTFVASPLEYWILNSAPIVQATQQRAKIFKLLINEYIKTKSVELFDMNNMKSDLVQTLQLDVASIPSGYMSEYNHLKKYPGLTFHAVDKDSKSINYVKENFPTEHTKTYCQDAWLLPFKGELDLINSNGLNIYIEDEEKIIALYQQFYESLKSGGALIISFITLPSEWKNYNPADLKKQTAIFKDVIQAEWQYFRSTEQTVNYLKKTGFVIKKTLIDKYNMFPTILALKE